ncbi:PREDICTED: uncharacterized protein LOC105556542 [Vollenhovia emeryi]|uniref:uncharacterized protein LOC105556542 n=1 Tax=Vollenhovia emeryi TaxID=411798 RepID=UPI0005F56199|nr:PREDICTED: uncharacterized protein LOC105556542 [Vollenhovia emeryi]
MKLYELVTLTYGTKPASYIAVKCVQQLAKDEGKRFPWAAKVVQEDFYMDDLLTGAMTVEELMELKHQLIELLKLGGFELHKWGSNAKVLNEGGTLNLAEFIEHEGGRESKLLGIAWSPKEDKLHFRTPARGNDGRVTKRTILSEIAQLFDPLGLMGSVTTFAKILMQSLWVSKVGWDDVVPMSIQNSWLLFRSQLTGLNYIEIPRLMMSYGVNQARLHGFCDASEKAYGACIYLVSGDSEQGISSTLMCSKSRVAPLKAVSLPRLELCGATLLVRLMNKVTEALATEVLERHYWTDSRIVLAWIGSSSRRWQTFVANRVGEIQNSSSSNEWHHVSSRDNPADLISRGVTPAQLNNSAIWWEGPRWLKVKNDFAKTDGLDVVLDSVPEERKKALTAISLVDNPAIDFIRFSSYFKLLRVMAYMLRFVGKFKKLNISYKEKDM